MPAFNPASADAVRPTGPAAAETSALSLMWPCIKPVMPSSFMMNIIEVGALSADLRSPADAGNGERSGRAPGVGAGLACCDAVAMFAADDERAFNQLGNYCDALGAFENGLGDAPVGSC